MTTEKNRCYHCEGLVSPKTGFEMELYDSPWDTIPNKVWVHSNEAITEAMMKRDGFDSYGQSCYDYLFDQGWADFRYFECQGCYRTICRQCPSNGWHVQVKEIDEEEVCLECYQRMILRDGHAREVFEGGRIPGMFFNHGNPEAKEAGYIEVAGFIYKHVTDGGEVCAKAIELIDSGHQVVIGYESLGIGGGEGYITMFKKEVIQ